MNHPIRVCLVLFGLLALLQPACADYVYTQELADELPAAREARHKRIAERRAGPILIVHRGANSIAPENSLEAFAAAMDYGADGCEVDIRQTRDGVLVLFHDDMLDRLVDAVGDMSEVTFAEAMQLRPRTRLGRVLPCHSPPTFAALLNLARQRAMLLHLDIKVPGLEAALARWLDQADAWDHVVSVSSYNSTNLLHHPKLKQLRYKTGLYEGRLDVDPAAVAAALPASGEMIMVDDPRVAARAMKRPPYQPVPLWAGLCVKPNLSAPPTRLASTNLSQYAFFTSLGRPARERAWAILSEEFPEGQLPEGDPAYQRQRSERILERAWAAWAVSGQRRNSRLVKLLENQVRQRSLHPDWRYQGLDGAMAARALASLRSTKSVPVLIEAFRRIDPELAKVANPEWSQNPLAWTDFRFKMVLLPTLGELDCAASAKFLWEDLSLDPAQVRELGPPQYEEATKALLRQKLSAAELTALLNHSNSNVRGITILELIDRPTRDQVRVLKSAKPWALELPPARLCKTIR